MVSSSLLRETLNGPKWAVYKEVLLKTSVEGFRQSALVELKLYPIHAVMLDWFVYFASSGRSETIEHDGRVFHWVSFNHLKTDLPCLEHTRDRQTVPDMFSRLCGGDKDNYPLIKLVRRVQRGTRVYFAIRGDVIDRMRNGGPMSDLGLRDGEPVVHEKLKRSRKLSPEIQGIVDELLALKRKGSGSPALFQNQPPEDAFHYTKAIERFGQKLSALYTGRWYRDYRVNDIFESRNHRLITSETMKAVKACRGSWSAVRDLVWAAARHYRKWWWADKEPTSKDWLPRDLSTWMYAEHNESSVFLACVLFEPDPAREEAIDKVYDSLLPEVQAAAERVLSSQWDQGAFWTRIRGVCSWYTRVKSELIRKDTNARYWFAGGVVEWFDKYVDWLVSLSGGNPRALYLKQIGVGNPTWDAWCTASAQRHHITADIPLDLSVD
jgi:hypothetical protein